MAAVAAAAEVAEAAVVASTGTTTIPTTGSCLLTISSQGLLRLKQELTAKLTHMQPVSINPMALPPCHALPDHASIY